ncbi:hypothetical protein ONS95_013522 [Cadophora gregata]|uniref:uncharacterized protein n=1 Tax=Cadophora gregata TaxID=51156 RepID=UPI0026DA902B|nr:uncharacterized protein ONS95_013522 [Cadophora gregata]KAK0116510.1 hypothetical protein ONS95_013522 [Cadophora gregata]
MFTNLEAVHTTDNPLLRRYNSVWNVLRSSCKSSKRPKKKHGSKKTRRSSKRQPSNKSRKCKKHFLLWTLIEPLSTTSPFSTSYLTEYTPDLNEEIGRLPPEISFEAMAHDIGVLSFAATLPKGSGDKELKKWAQISFTLLGDVKKPVNERLCNLIWLVAKKIDLAITTMQKHVKAVQKEILKGYEERFNDPVAADIMKLRHEDHRKRGDILAEKYSDLRKLLRVRFGDAEDKFKDKHKDDLKLKGEIPKEEIEQMKVATQAAEVEEFRLASRDSSA